MRESTYRVDRRTLAADWPLLVLMLLTIGVTAWAFPRLPGQSPVHWGVSGTADRFAGPWFVALWWPVFAAGLYLLLLYLPLLDPKRQNYADFGRTYSLIRQAIPGLILVLHLAQLAEALGMGVSTVSVLLLAISALFLGLGLAMSRFRPNYFVGIRTPWTLASAEVWRRTHQFTGRAWVALSLLQAAAVLLLPLRVRFLASMAVAAVMVILPVVYSYRVYRQVNG
ncbi:putative membrane protein [Symbiobacterium terraclitae]|uniref:Membrane protein n=1 Tax=Symbiobacterium terraclitae TaxID=557451 RepID=A0ABS4JVZ8_9FIRM|nr:SdpI family protein [Symbiobacterium terraclitae]MBP2019727.1 putative membrane protein [Symbiobacterium terraclitae]